MSADNAILPAQMEERLRFETLIANLSSQFVHLPSDRLDQQIEDAQSSVCECLGLDVSSLWQWAPEDPNTLIMTHLYRRVPGPPTPERFDAREYFPWALERLRAGKAVVWSMNDLPEEAARDVEVWLHFGLKSVLNLPLSVGGNRPIGLLAFNDMCSIRQWTEPLVQRLQLVAEVFTNALERRRADLALQENEQRLSLAADSAGAGLWSLNFATSRYWLTNKTRELFNFGPDEVVTFDRFLSAVHSEDRPTVRQVINEVVHSGREGVIEFRVLSQHGKVKWISSRGRVDYGENGKPTHLRGVSLDVTEKREAQETLERSFAEITELKDRLSLATAAGNVGLWMWDVTNDLIWATENWRRMFGFPPEAIIRYETFLQRVHESDRQAVALAVERAFSQKADYVSEHRVLLPDAAIRWITAHGRMHPGAVATQVRMLGASVDITDLKRAEEAARDLSGRLLGAQEVERARLAQELHDGLNQNLALLSIEMEMFGQSLPAAPGEIGARLKEFSRQAKGLSAEVHRISHGLHPAKLKQLGLAVAMRSVCREVEAAHGITVHLETRDIPRVLPDDVALCLYRVTQEAIQNVVKHSGAKSARVELMASGNTIYLAVGDDGKGFDVDAEPDKSSLGLVSMRERVRFVRGDIDVKSKPGNGTCIEARVPLPNETRR
jgi:PAS domain S-box-containing protein